MEIIGRLGKDLEGIMKSKLSDYREYQSEFIIVEFMKRYGIKVAEELYSLYSWYITVE